MGRRKYKKCCNKYDSNDCCPEKDKRSYKCPDDDSCKRDCNYDLCKKKKKKHFKKCCRVDSNFYTETVKFNGECSKSSLPLTNDDGIFLLVIDWAQLFVSADGSWNVVPQTFTYIFHCVEDGTFWKVIPDKFSKNYNDVVCAKKFDTLLDCETNTVYTLTEIKLIPKGCILRWVEDCQISVVPHPLYTTSNLGETNLIFNEWITVQVNLALQNTGWTTDNPGVWNVPIKGAYKTDFAISLRSGEGTDVTTADTIEIRYFVDDIPVGALHDQQIIRLVIDDETFDGQQLASGCAILSMLKSAKFEIRVRQITNNGTLIQINNDRSAVTAFKVAEFQVQA